MKPFARHKFRAKPTVRNGRRYDSKLEAAYADKLLVLQRAGTVLGWLEQVPLHLPGGVVYRCDFLVFYADGRAEFVEVKGMETESWRAKHRMVAELYPWADVRVVRRGEF
jgi:hypothetical protein